MSRLRSLASAVWLSGALLGLTHCDSTVNGIAVVVTLSGLPADAQQVQVVVSVNGKGSNRDRPPLMLAPGTSRFAVALPDGTSSTANITVNAVAADGCLLATGTASVQPTSGTRGYDLTLPLMPDNSCLLTGSAPIPTTRAEKAHTDRFAGDTRSAGRESSPRGSIPLLFARPSDHPPTPLPVDGGVPLKTKAPTHRAVRLPTHEPDTIRHGSCKILSYPAQAATQPRPRGPTGGQQPGEQTAGPPSNLRNEPP